jgi:hypothetical protein
MESRGKPLRSQLHTSAALTTPKEPSTGGWVELTVGLDAFPSEEQNRHYIKQATVASPEIPFISPCISPCNFLFDTLQPPTPQNFFQGEGKPFLRGAQLENLLTLKRLKNILLIVLEHSGKNNKLFKNSIQYISF